MSCMGNKYQIVEKKIKIQSIFVYIMLHHMEDRVNK